MVVCLTALLAIDVDKELTALLAVAIDGVEDNAAFDEIETVAVELTPGFDDVDVVVELAVDVVDGTVPVFDTLIDLVDTLVLFVEMAELIGEVIVVLDDELNVVIGDFGVDVFVVFPYTEKV